MPLSLQAGSTVQRLLTSRLDALLHAIMRELKSLISRADEQLRGPQLRAGRHGPPGRSCSDPASWPVNALLGSLLYRSGLV